MPNAFGLDLGRVDGVVAFGLVQGRFSCIRPCRLAFDLGPNAFGFVLGEAECIRLGHAGCSWLSWAALAAFGSFALDHVAPSP